MVQLMMQFLLTDEVSRVSMTNDLFCGNSCRCRWCPQYFKNSNICTCKPEAYTGTLLGLDQVKTHTPIHPQGDRSGYQKWVPVLDVGSGIRSECWICVYELAMDVCWVCKLATGERATYKQY